MEQTLSSGQERLIQEKVASGRYQTPNEVVEVALRLLDREEERQRQRHEQLHGQIEEGITALTRGEHRDYADWRDLAEEIKAEGRKQLSQEARAAG